MKTQGKLIVTTLKGWYDQRIAILKIIVYHKD